MPNKRIGAAAIIMDKTIGIFPVVNQKSMSLLKKQPREKCWRKLA
jgi:hypothetical protein